MRKRGTGFAASYSRNYLTRRATELATPATRARTEPLGQWALHRIRLDGRPFSFVDHEFLRPIYDDTAPHIVLSKAAQIGGTVWAVLRAIHSCVLGLNVVYFFPTRTDVLDFSRARVKPLLEDNPFLRKMLRDTDTAGLKRIGEAHLYLRGMQSTVGMKSVPADLIVFDELDEASPDAKTMAKERLAHSDYKRIVELSNPSLPDYGIDEAYQRSDQRHWTVKCGACGTWTSMEKEFPAKLGEDVRVIRPRSDGTFYRACPKCEAELDISAGEWVADFPERPIHGYRISQLISPRVDPGEILEDYRTTRFPDRFYNLKIGIPWADLDRRLDVASVLRLCRERAMGDVPTGEGTAMGVDTGRQLHVVILRRDRGRGDLHHVIHLQTCREFSELDELMQRFDVRTCVIDGLPETHSTRDFASRHSGRVYLNFFNEHQRGSAAWKHDVSIVQINRTEALDASRAAVRESKITLPRQCPVVEEFAQHMASDAKILEEDPDTGAKRYKYVRTGPDHYSLAFTYAWMAAPTSFCGGGRVVTGHWVNIMEIGF